MYGADGLGQGEGQDGRDGEGGGVLCQQHDRRQAQRRKCPPLLACPGKKIVINAQKYNYQLLSSLRYQSFRKTFCNTSFDYVLAQTFL